MHVKGYQYRLPHGSSPNCLPFAFADDIQLLFKSQSDFPDVLQSVIDDTSRILCDWMCTNGLSVNTDKTKAIRFTNHGDVSVNFGNVPIAFVDRVKRLGVVLDSDLSFQPHISAICSRINFLLRRE
ncbi:uncharacterized protein LOC142236534 [Haematobia irritans]|uniref:uncharacterized protein LOC142236534 n=1 Tax=Haematobia irritans TaxID=7368 RepID=UPI003F50118E